MVKNNLYPDVFISYNHLSIEIVKMIAKQLEDEHINCWYAPRNLDDEGAGEQYDDVITKTIPKVSVVVVVVTDAALASKWVKMEVTMADDMEKSIIPFEITPTNIINGLTSRLAIRHKIIAYPNPEEKIGQLVKNVKRKLNDTIPSDSEQTNRQHYYEVDTNTPTIDFYFEEGEALYSMKEYAEAALPYLKSAIQGNSRAKDRLCTMFFHLNNNVKVITRDIWEIIEPQAENGHCYACFLMSCKYHNNPQTNSLAYDYLRKAIRTNTVPLALLRLGIYYGWGMGVKQSSILSMLYYRKAIDAGCKEAYSYIGGEYLFGNDKYDVDREKGLNLLKKGADLLDERSMLRLAKEYMTSADTIDKAREIANKMIELEYYQGYCILGDCYWINNTNVEDLSDKDKKEAENCYKEATSKDESSGFGQLSFFYYFFEGNKAEAIKMAKRGRSEKDPISIQMLGTIYLDEAQYYDDENHKNEAFENAWQCFEERFDLFGVGSVDMAKIFLDHHYVPNQYRSDKTMNIINKLKGESNDIIEKMQEDKINELIDSLLSKLKIEAHRGTSDAITTILRLYCYKKYGNSELDYTIITDVPETISFLALGAHKGDDPEMTFYYGKCLLEHEVYYNIGKGIKLVENAANKKNKDALNYLIERYGNKEKKYDDDEQFYLFAKETIDEGTLSKDNMKYIGRILAHYEEDEKYIIDVAKIRALVDSYIKPDDASFLREIGDSLNILYPNYDENSIFKDWEHAGKIERWLFYSKNYANNAEKDVDLQDSFLERLHSLFVFDESLIQDNSIYDSDIKELIQAMENYQSSYRTVCKKEEITPIEYQLPESEHLFPYMPSSVCARISYDTFNLFLTLQYVMPDIYEPMFPLLRDDSAMLDYIETLKNQDLQLFLISLIEIKLDIETIMLNNYGLYKNYRDNNMEPIVEYLNKILKKYGNRVTSKETIYTSNNLPDFSEITPKRILKSNDFFEEGEKDRDIVLYNTSNKQEEEDEFERLLNEFINSSSKGEEPQ